MLGLITTSRLKFDEIFQALMDGNVSMLECNEKFYSIEEGKCICDDDKFNVDDDDVRHYRNKKSIRRENILVMMIKIVMIMTSFIRT